LKNQEETDAEAEQKDMSEEYIFPDSNSEVVGFKTDGTIVIALRE